MDRSVNRRRLAISAASLVAASGVYRPDLVSAQSGDPAPGTRPPVILASDFGPIGDGIADDSDALQAALDLAESQGGGLVMVSPGTYRCNVVIGSRTTLAGAGQRATILMSVAGSDRAVIEGRDFATLTGTNKQTPETRGANYVGITSLTVDGDRANNTAGAGIRIWGRSQIFRDLIVQNCAEDGVFLEFTTHDAGGLEDNIEGVFSAIKTIANGGNGWTHRGPHDSTLSDFVTFSNAGWGLKSEGRNGSYNGGINGTGWNSWLNGLGSFHFGVSPGYLSDSAATGPNSGVGIELVENGGSTRMTGILISGHETGLYLRGGNHLFSGVILNAISNRPDQTGIGVLFEGAGLCLVDVTGSGNECAIAFSDEFGPNIVRGRFSVPTGGQLLMGTVSAATSLDLAQIGPEGARSIVRVPVTTPGEITEG